MLAFDAEDDVGDLFLISQTAVFAGLASHDHRLPIETDHAPS